MGDLHEPVLPGSAATDYERYLRTDELLSLQKSAEEVVHRDEHLFQAVHQSSELWLKLACLEIEAATALVDADKPAAATRLVRRGSDAMLLITTQLGMLEHMSPCDYAVVRTALGHGAGFDSPGFRRAHRGGIVSVARDPWSVARGPWSGVRGPGSGVRGSGWLIRGA